MNPFPPVPAPFLSQANQHNHRSLYESPSMPSPSGSLPPPSALASAPPSRPGSGLQMAYLLHPPTQQGTALPMPPTSSPYAHSYDSGSGSPADRASVLTDGNGSLPEAPSLVQHMGGAAGQPPQKRAYRQRRKDPSCDACRERKVKVRKAVAFQQAFDPKLWKLSATLPSHQAVQNVRTVRFAANSPKRPTDACLPSSSSPLFSPGRPGVFASFPCIFSV